MTYGRRSDRCTCARQGSGKWLLPGKNMPENTAGRCGARTRRGTACLCQGDGRGGRCKFHGGASTGPKTEAGRAKIAALQRARWERFRALKGDLKIARLWGILADLKSTRHAAPKPATTKAEIGFDLAPGELSKTQEPPIDTVAAPAGRRSTRQTSSVPNRYARAHLRRGSRR